MERCPTQAVLPLVGLAADQVIRDRYRRNPTILRAILNGRRRLSTQGVPAPRNGQSPCTQVDRGTV
ncbi:MAG: hypothetical protein ACQESR_03115 [Planctomycetota bacterium]